MNWLDVFIAVVLALSVLQGLRIGLIKAAFSLAGIVAGLLLAKWFYVPVSGLLSFIPSPNLAKVAAFALIVVAVVVLATIVSSLLKGVVSAIGLGLADRVGGAIFSLLLSAFFLASLLAVVATFPFLGLDGVIKDSALATFLIERLPLLPDLLPSEFNLSPLS